MKQEAIKIITDYQYLYKKCPLTKLHIKLKNKIVLCVGKPRFLVDGVLANIDYTDDNVCPYKEGTEIMVPIEFVNDALGANINWDNKNNMGTISLNNKVIKLKVGSKKIFVDDKQKRVSVAITMLNERVYIPLSIIKDFGKKVFLYEKGVVVITDNKTKPNLNDSLINQIIEKTNKVLTD